MAVAIPFWQLLVLALIPTLPAVFALVASVRNKQAIQEVHLSVNSRMDELLKITGDAKRAEGVKAGAEGKA